MPLFICLDADSQASLISCKLMQRRAKAVEKETSGIQVKVQPCWVVLEAMLFHVQLTYGSVVLEWL
jgi:hypothetical protein